MVSIITTWRDRGELSRTLQKLLDCTALLGGDLTVVNFDGSRQMLAEQVRGFEDRVRLVHIDGQQYFHKARAQNLGVACTTNDLLFFCDVDILLEPATLATLIRMLLEKPDSFATLAAVRETELNARGGNNVVCFGYELQVRVANEIGRASCRERV